MTVTQPNCQLGSKQGGYSNSPTIDHLQSKEDLNYN